MATIQQIQKSSVPKPDMIGDLIEVTIYSQADGSLSTVAGTLTGYAVRDGDVYLFLQDITDDVEVDLDDYTLSITHYEYPIDFVDADQEDSE